VGISFAPIYEGPIYALRNVIYRTGVGNNDYSGMPFKFNSGYDQSGPMYLFHNTADAALPDNDGFDINSPDVEAISRATTSGRAPLRAVQCQSHAALDWITTISTHGPENWPGGRLPIGI
jgi:hypothetical protein